MYGVVSVPCPVRLGSIRSGGVSAQLHLFTRERNMQRLEKLLKQGVCVDSVNNLGQTCLYCACLLGFTAVAELLLRYAADPNHRCDDRSTPVHASVFSCDTRLLSKLLEAGGDLRLHDDRGRTPRDWAAIGAQKNSAKMLGFIKSCTSVMRSLCESHGERRVAPTSPETLLCSPSLLDFLKPVSDMVLSKKVTSKARVSDSVRCFGFGKLCVATGGVSAGTLASLPLTSDSELLQAEDEALNSFPCGSVTGMANYSWRGSRVTVKELQIDHTHPRAGQHHHYLDLLITELNFCCQLFHPHLLQLMAVSSSNDLLQIKLVYERVHVGSLYTLFYHQRAEFPFLQVDEVLSLILQVCEALFYLHGRSLVLRCLSSHSVLIVHPGVAKITGFGFAVPSERTPSPTPPVPVTLYNWAAPEAIQRKPCTEKADLYSVCALIQEFYTDAVPWGSVNPLWIKQAVDAGQALAADPSVPQPYYDLLLKGLKPRAQERTCSLQDLRYTLRSDLRELSERRREVRHLPVRSSPHGWNTEDPDEDQVVEQDIQDHLLEQASFQAKPKSTLSNVRTSDSDECLQEDTSFQESPRPSPSTPSVDDEGVGEESKMPTSNHINSIILNLKVSQVLLQQVESSLELTEWRMTENARADVPRFDGSKGRRENQVLVLEAVGPPSRYRPPSRCFEELEEDVTEFHSAEEKRFESSEEDKNSSEEDEKMGGGQEQPFRYTRESCQSSVTSTSQEQHHRPEHHRAEYHRPEHQGAEHHRPKHQRPEHHRAEHHLTEYHRAEHHLTEYHRPEHQGAEHHRPEYHLTEHHRPEHQGAEHHLTEHHRAEYHRPEHQGTEHNRAEHHRPEHQGAEHHLTEHHRAEYHRPEHQGAEHHRPEHQGAEYHLTEHPRAEHPRAKHQCPEHPRAEHPRTGVLSAAVSRITRRFLNRAARSSDDEDAQEDAHLEQLFKSFAAGLHGESDESTDFHSTNHTFAVPRSVQKVKGQHTEDDSDSDYTHSPAEPSSIFYTPQDLLENTKTKQELSQNTCQTVSSEDDPDVTLEVCRPNMTTETTLRECRSSPDEPLHTEPPSIHTTRSSHLADIAQLSSITCSPAQHQEKVDACFNPHSTPRSPHTHSGQDQSAPNREDHASTVVPHLHSLMETSLWGSAEFLSHMETSDPAGPKCTETIHPAVPGLLWSLTTERTSPHGGSDMPSSGNPEFTTASSVVRNCETKKSQELSDTALKASLQDSADADVLIVDEKECKKCSDSVELPVEEEEEQQPDPNQTELVCNAASSVEETQRAHGTLDEVLQGLTENPEGHRTQRGVTVTTGEEWTETCQLSVCAQRESGDELQVEEEEEVMKSVRSRDTSEDAGATNTLSTGDRTRILKQHVSPSGSHRTGGLFWSTYPPKRDATLLRGLCPILPPELH